MNRTFNNGIGMVLVVPARSRRATAATLAQLGEGGVPSSATLLNAARVLRSCRLSDLLRHVVPVATPTAPRADRQLSAGGPAPCCWSWCAGLLPGLLCVCLGNRARWLAPRLVRLRRTPQWQNCAAATALAATVVIIGTHRALLFHSIPFHSFPFHSIPVVLHSIPFLHFFHSIPFHSIPFHSPFSPFHSFHSVHSIPFHSIVPQSTKPSM